MRRLRIPSELKKIDRDKYRAEIVHADREIERQEGVPRGAAPGLEVLASCADV